MLLSRFREPGGVLARGTWKQAVDMDADDLHLKPSNAIDRSGRRGISRGNWS